MTKLTTWLKWFWTNHVQKTMAYIAGTLTGLDLIGYAEPVKAFVGQKGYYAVVLGCAVITAARAHQSKQPPIPAPPA